VFSGSNNGALQGLLNQGLANANPVARQRVSAEIGNLENQKQLVTTKSLNDAGEFTPNQLNIFFEKMSL
jgi:hypothetical protein